MKKYELFFGDIHIGSLVETGWDMRSAGTIEYDFNYLEPEEKHTRLAKYIRLSIESSRYLENGDEENYQACCEEENKYLDFINSEDWYIVTHDGKKEKILCPAFHENDEIVWQLSLD